MRTPPQPESSSLLELQRTIAQTLMRPLRAGERMHPEARAIAERLIKPNDRLTSFERLELYNQQYWWRLLGNLREDFRGLRAVLGERRFERLAVAYLETCGSKSWTLRDLGSRLEEFLTGHPELAGSYLPLALDVLRVEWARIVAFDGPERPALVPAMLQQTAPEQLQLALQPFLTVLELRHPVDQLLSRLRRSNIETGSVSNAVTASRRRGPIRLAARPSSAPLFLAVHRVEFAVYYKRLEPGAFRILQALRDEATLADACAAAFLPEEEPPADAAAQVQQWFAAWMRFGWLCAR
ncbi:MAG TPA: putative DNA-binding domain-containing protein [Chthoniobacteraceae bacterium]|jgi:hypothetical protein